MERYHHQDRSDSRDRNGFGRKRDRSPERVRGRGNEQQTIRNEILSVLKNVLPINASQREAIDDFVRDIDRKVSNNDKDSKELFVGNVVDSDASENNLCLFLNSAMRQLGLVRPADEPIIACRKSKNYCFVVFESSVECSMAINMTGIPFKDAALKLKRPAEYTGPTNSIFTWEDFVPQPKMQRSLPIAPAAASAVPHPGTLLLREIFVGNTNADMTDQALKDFIGGAMMKMGLSHSCSEHPVHHVRVTGQFAFMEMQTCVDAANVLNLSGIPFCNSHLKIMRTKKYDGGCGIEAYLKWDVLLQMWVSGDLRLMTSGAPSRVLVVNNVTTAEALSADPNLYLDIIEDTRLECSQFGTVRSVIVPRSTSSLNYAGSAVSGSSNSSGNPVGKVFVEMDLVDQAVLTLLSLKVWSV